MLLSTELSIFPDLEDCFNDFKQRRERYISKNLKWEDGITYLTVHWSITGSSWRNQWQLWQFLTLWQLPDNKCNDVVDSNLSPERENWVTFNMGSNP